MNYLQKKNYHIILEIKIRQKFALYVIIEHVLIIHLNTKIS